MRRSSSLRFSPRSTSGSKTKYVWNTPEPMDVLTVDVIGLQLSHTETRDYRVRVTIMDEIIVSAIVTPAFIRETLSGNSLCQGKFYYDPKDLEKMCHFANNPMQVTAYPVENITGSEVLVEPDTKSKLSGTTSTASSNESRNIPDPSDISSCNIDILPLFIDETKLYVRKRLEPRTAQSVLKTKSWNCLPLLSMTLSVERHDDFNHYHEMLKAANVLKITLVGAFNLPITFNQQFTYTASTKLPSHRELTQNVVTYTGEKIPKTFDSFNFYPLWEDRRGLKRFAKGDAKLEHKPENVLNYENINFMNYLRGVPRLYTTKWGSFHRTLLIGEDKKQFENYIRHHKWPFELHIQNILNQGFSFMGFADLNRLLEPGVSCNLLVVPLVWYTAKEMIDQCNCKPFNEISLRIPEFNMEDSDTYVRPNTGRDDYSAFLIVEFSLAKPVKKLSIPPLIETQEIDDMLVELQKTTCRERQCSGRGQLSSHWASASRIAASRLRALPQCGTTEYCAFVRQFSETRTRVEIMASFCDEGAIFVNNNFNLQDFLTGDQLYRELLELSHICLVTTTLETLIPAVKNTKSLSSTLKAARQARQMQDPAHATELYLLQTKENSSDGNNWRELATCLKEQNVEWATVCIDKALRLNIRHPLTFLIKTCMVYEENVDDAEPFFFTLLAWFPFWATMLIIAQVYFDSRELYVIADKIMSYFKQIRRENMVEEPHFARAWECELGDWWDPTPLLPGSSPYYDAADLLLRIRCFKLADMCMAKAVLESGETAAYYHLVALSCRLRGNTRDALCHLEQGIDKFGDIAYLKTLEGECFHKQDRNNSAKTSFEKARAMCGFSIILSTTYASIQRKRSLIVDLVRRQPSAYAWMSLAEIWLKHESGRRDDSTNSSSEQEAVQCAVACAEQALMSDRRCARAWAVLADLVHPSARRKLCRKMAVACGHVFPEELGLIEEYDTPSQQTMGHELGWMLPVCDRDPIYF